jgi:hypothetical protein
MPGADVNLENFCSHLLPSGTHDSVIVESPEGKSTFQLPRDLLFFSQRSSNHVFIYSQYLMQKMPDFSIFLDFNAI